MEEAEGSAEQRVIADEEIEEVLSKLAQNPDTQEMAELLKMMHDNRIMSWEETERAMQEAGGETVVKSGLKQVSRPSEPDNDTDVDKTIARLQANDEKLVDINLNNMKRTPIPQMQRLFMAVKDNSYLKKLSLANTGLTDTAAEPLTTMLEGNTTLESLNLETNYLSGEFLARLFQSTLVNKTLREIKIVNQSAVFSTAAEKAMLEVIQNNPALTKVSVQMRMPEARQKIDNAMLRNGEIRRLQRKKEAEEAKKPKGRPPMISRPTEDS